MARNSEKAMTTLARWHQMKSEEEKGPKIERRPYLSTLCESLPEAEKWRGTIIRDIAKKVSQIQNAGLGEFKLRDLNDEINKLLREKGHWERRIRQLGGPDYPKHGPRMLDNEGREVPGTRGYKYFGAAKDLPGVRELFEPDAHGAPRKTRGELMRDVDADYYGYRDDDDGILEPLEKEAEKISLAKLEEEFRIKMEKKGKSTKSSQVADDDNENMSTDNATEEQDDEDDENLEESKVVKNYFIQVPSQEEIEAKILNLKKKKLMEQYVSPDIIMKEQQAKELMGIAPEK